MRLEKLSLYQLTNHKQSSLATNADVVCITGHNGAGKTNVLEAIALVASGRSALGTKDGDLVLQGEDQGMVKATLVRGGKASHLAWGWDHGQKSYTLQGKPVGKISEHLGQFPVVLATPNDTDLVRGAPELRRRYFDSLFSQLDRAYLADLMAYHHLLKQRNSLLRQVYRWTDPHLDLLASYDHQLVPLAQNIAQARQHLLEEYVAVFAPYYEQIAGPEEPVDIELQSTALLADFAEQWQRQVQSDQDRERTQLGPHRDEFEFSVAGKLARTFASQGQQKSFLLALKLAEHDLLAHKLQEKPLLLLDDIYDRLDPDRLAHLMQLVGQGHFDQVFITDTHPDRVARQLAAADCTVLRVEVEQGSLTLVP